MSCCQSPSEESASYRYEQEEERKKKIKELGGTVKDEKEHSMSCCTKPTEVVMDAIAARKLSTSHLRGPIIQPYLVYIHTRIQTTAKAGKFEINDPFSFPSGDYPTPEAQEAIKHSLRQLGYKITDHSDPDPGYPGSHAYTTISW